MNYYNKPRKVTKPLKEALPHTRNQRISTSSQLYKNIEAIFLKNEDYFEVDHMMLGGDEPMKNPEVYQKLQTHIDPQKMPEKFRELFALDANKLTSKEQILELFEKSRYLNMEKGNPSSSRIIFIDDKVLIFRNETHVVHKDGGKHTQGEKRRYEVKKYVNTFPNIYDALRSQYHTIENMENDKETCLALIQDIQRLAREIREIGFGSKDDEFKRKINDIIEELGDVRDYKKLGTILFNLEELSFSNKVVASNQLTGASNKLKDRFKNLSTMLGTISFRDIPKLERIIQRHKESLTMFLAQIAFNANQEWVFGEYRQRLATLTSRNILNHQIDQTYFDWKSDVLPEYVNIAPFGGYYKRLLSAYESKDKEALRSEAKKIEEEFKKIELEHNASLNSPK